MELSPPQELKPVVCSTPPANTLAGRVPSSRAVDRTDEAPHRIFIVIDRVEKDDNSEGRNEGYRSKLPVADLDLLVNWPRLN